MRHWRLHTWQHILFSDESRFSLRFSDGRYRVYHMRGERFTDQCVYESDRFGGGGVMVWVGICHDGRTYRVHAINAQLVTVSVIMPTKEEHRCDSGSESLDKHEPM
jgi:hypothetical protein